MLKGTISITCDPRTMAAAMYNGYTIVCMKNKLEPEEYLGPDPIYASILLPQYEAMSAYLDSNDALAKQMYMNYLTTREPDMYLCALLAASIKNINVLIYIDKDMYEMGFVRIFCEYMYLAYGVSLNTSETEYFCFDQNALGMILSKLYLYDFIDMDTFFIMYPQGMLLQRFVLPKLVSEFNPFSVPRSEEEYFGYFMSYKENMKTHGNNQPLIIPFITNGNR